MPLRRSTNAVRIGGWSVVLVTSSLEVRSMTVRYFCTIDNAVVLLYPAVVLEALMRKEDASRISRSA